MIGNSMRNQWENEKKEEKSIDGLMDWIGMFCFFLNHVYDPLWSIPQDQDVTMGSMMQW